MDVYFLKPNAKKRTAVLNHAIKTMETACTLESSKTSSITIISKALIDCLNQFVKKTKKKHCFQLLYEDLSSLVNVEKQHSGYHDIGVRKKFTYATIQNEE